MTAGDSRLRLRYEMENLTQMLLTGEDRSSIHLTKTVTNIMDTAIQSWGMDWVND